VEENKLNLLVDLYNHQGWKYLEQDIKDRVKSAQSIVKKTSTPTKDREFACGQWNALEALLDKVEADKISKEQTQD